MEVVRGPGEGRPCWLLAPLHLLVVGARVLVARHVARLIHQVHTARPALAPA